MIFIDFLSASFVDQLFSQLFFSLRRDVNFPLYHAIMKPSKSMWTDYISFRNININP